MLFSFLSSAWSSSFCFFSAGDSSCSCGTSPALGWRWPTGASREGAPCAKALLKVDAVTKIRADATTANRMTRTPVQTSSPTNVRQRLFDKPYAIRDWHWHLAGRQRVMQMFRNLIDLVDFPELIQKLRIARVEACNFSELGTVTRFVLHDLAPDFDLSE